MHDSGFSHSGQFGLVQASMEHLEEVSSVNYEVLNLLCPLLQKKDHRLVK